MLKTAEERMDEEVIYANPDDIDMDTNNSIPASTGEGTDGYVTMTSSRNPRKSIISRMPGNYLD